MELADACLVSPSRFGAIKKFQIDSSTNERWLLISIRIEETKVRNEKDVDSIIRDINTMIKSNDQTPIRQGHFAKYLDSSFGFKPARVYFF